MIYNNKLPNNKASATYTASDPDKRIPLKISIKISGLSCRHGSQYRRVSTELRIAEKKVFKDHEADFDSIRILLSKTQRHKANW